LAPCRAGILSLSAPHMSSITISGITKRFGSVRAVDRVSVEIAKGEMFFLLGPSGCGKTTLLRTVAGFYYPDEGRIIFGEEDVSELPPDRRNTGMVFQHYALWPHMTVRGNLSFGLEMRGYPRHERRKRVDDALAQVKMEAYAERLPGQLSGGQQQRVALARALVIEPRVVLMDEPLSNLDANLRLEMRSHIKRLHEEIGMTVIYVTHDQHEALSMADRLAVMMNGKLVQTGTPREVYYRPATREVGQFIGETNFMTGNVREAGEMITIDTPAGTIVASGKGAMAGSGETVVCSIRPESWDILGAGEERPNMLRARVRHVYFHGNHEQYELELADGSEVKVIDFAPSGRVTAGGSEIRIGCRSEDVQVFPEPAGSVDLKS